MNDYILDNRYRFISKTVTKGTQDKYKKEDYYYKVNKLGNEGLVEHLVSLLLINSTLSSSCYVFYEFCTINGKLGCRSKNFLESKEEFISMNALYSRLTGNVDLADYLSSLPSAKERLDFLLDIVAHFIEETSVYKRYLNVLMQLDLLILNTDRHVHNYGLIYDRELEKYKVPPIFDNGLALKTDMQESFASCTLSGSFVEQVTVFGYPIVSCFKVDYENLYKDLSEFEKKYGKKKEILVLLDNLKKYENLFRL